MDRNDKCARASCVHSRMLSSASVLRFMAAAPRDVAVAPSIQRLRIGLHAVFSPIFPIEMLLSSPTESEMSCSLSPLLSFRVLNACGPQPASQKTYSIFKALPLWHVAGKICPHPPELAMQCFLNLRRSILICALLLTITRPISISCLYSKCSCSRHFKIYNEYSWHAMAKFYFVPYTQIRIFAV